VKASTPPEGQVRSRVFLIVTLLVSLACLVAALHGVSWRDLWHGLRGLEWHWVAIGVIANILVYVIQGWRWSLLLKPITPAPVWSCVKAIYVGLFANEVLPLRAGELIRCFLQARWSAIPVSVALATALIERIFDGIWLIVGLFFTLDFIRHLKLGRGQTRAITVLTDGLFSVTILIVVGAALLAVAMYWRQPALDALFNARMFGWVHVFVEDLHRIGHSRYLYFSAIVSFFYLAMQVIPIYTAMQAYHLHESSWTLAAALVLIQRLGTAVPQAPGNVGLFQVLSTIVLTTFGVPVLTARPFALILWVIVTLPLLLVGFAALVATGANMGDIQKEARAEMRARQDAFSRT
jgi:uncharacterized protein (TIRG00374 family)